MRIDKPLAIVIPVLIVLAVLLALLVPWRCSAQTGTAGTISLSIDYTARQDEIMTAQYGPDWQAVVKQRHWREAWKNLLGTAREANRERKAVVFGDDFDQYLTRPETRRLQEIYDSAQIRKATLEAERRLADSAAATGQEIGEHRIEENGIREVVTDPELIGMNVGKGLSSRLEFLGSFITPPMPPVPEPAPPSGLPFSESSFITYIYVVHILALIGLAATVYMVYTGVTM